MGVSAVKKDNFNASKGNTGRRRRWRQREPWFLMTYLIVFYVIIIRRSLQISHDHHDGLHGLRPGWLLPHHLKDDSDAQWRNFQGNIPILILVFGIYTLLAITCRVIFKLKARGMSIVWLLFSFIYLSYLHGACIIFVLSIATVNFLLVKVCIIKKKQWAFLDSYRGTFRWHICFNFVVLRMISFGFDYHWAKQDPHFDQKKHHQRCLICKSGKSCYQILQERSVQDDKFAYSIYLCYLVYAPLYIAGPILSFNAFASQLDASRCSISFRNVAYYGLRWLLSLLLMELMTHFFYYNAFAISGLWKQLSPMEVFIIGYGVLNFMWLKFLLIWRYFRFWSLINGIEAPENMPKCINNCYNFEGFWKNWHASFNKWLVRYIYIPLGGSKKKLLNVWVVFTFVAIWHDLEWKLLSWAWLTCLFFIPELVMKSATKAFKAESAFGEYIFREISAIAGAVTITCLMMANLVGFVIGPSGINLLLSSFLHKDGLPVLGGMFLTFYVATKLMFHIEEEKQRSP